MAASDQAWNRESDATKHGDIEAKIRTRAVEAVMPKNVPDRLHAHTPTEQTYREGVPQPVYVLGAVGQIGRIAE